MNDLLKELGSDFTLENLDKKIKSNTSSEIIKHSSRNSDLDYEILDDYGILKQKKYSIYFRKVNWNGYVKFDIRSWSDDGRPFKGITLNEEELSALYHAGKQELSRSTPLSVIKDLSSGKITCKLIKHILIFSSTNSKDGVWNKELNLIDWGYGVKFDLRQWKESYERTGKGISLDHIEFEKLIELIEKHSILK